MIVLIHTIWHVIAELSLPTWQKEVRDITHEVIVAMKEAKKYGTLPGRAAYANLHTLGKIFVKFLLCS